MVNILCFINLLYFSHVCPFFTYIVTVCSVTYINPAFLPYIVSNSTTSPRYGTSFRVLHCLYGSEPEVDDCDDVFHEADDYFCTTNNTLAHGHGYPTNSQTLPTRRNKHRYCRLNCIIDMFW